MIVFVFFLQRCSWIKTLGSQHESLLSDCVSSSFCFPPIVKLFTIWTPVFPSVCLSRCLWQHAAEDVYEVVQSQQVAVLPVALHPGSPMVQGLGGQQRDRLPEVDHPHSGLPRGVMHEQQGAAHNLRWRNRCDMWV